jgi:hypothetical protein
MSDFGAKINEQRHQLTTQLVTKVLGLQVRGAARQTLACTQPYYIASCWLSSHASTCSCYMHACFEHLDYEMISCLVCTAGLLQPEDENFSLAHDFCLQKEYYHSFGDVNPAAVEGFYAE